MRRFYFLTSQLSDIKTTLLILITNEGLKETARGAIKFRRFNYFLSGIAQENQDKVLISDKLFDELLKITCPLKKKQKIKTSITS